jgi:hypothetical protein
MFRTVSLITGAPLQVLSLFEAEHAYGLQDSGNLVVATPYAQRLMRGIGMEPANLVSFDYMRGSSLKTYSSIRRMMLNVTEELEGGSPDVLLIGTPGLAGRSLFARTRPQQTVILEDGTATLKFLRRYEPKQNRSDLARGFMREHVLRYFGLTSSEIRGADIFTPLGIETHPFGHVVRHDFPRLRAQGSFANVDRDSVLLLGRYENPDHELFLRADSMGLIAQGQSVLFKPHPAVSGPVPPRGTSIMDPVLSGLPVEFALLQMGYVPGTIAGFGSSALLTLRYLVPSDVHIVDLSDSR